MKRAWPIVLALPLAAAPAVAAAQSNNSNRAVQISLRDQLAFGLKARTPQQFAFVDRVVVLVDTGVLSKRLVNICFEYARSKPDNVQFFYFEQALRTLARRQKIVV